MVNSILNQNRISFNKNQQELLNCIFQLKLVFLGNKLIYSSSIIINFSKISYNMNYNFNKSMAFHIILVIFSMASPAMAADGCHVWGGVNICCNNEGYGPRCAYCPGGTCTGSNTGATCDRGAGVCNND